MAKREKGEILHKGNDFRLSDTHRIRLEELRAQMGMRSRSEVIRGLIDSCYESKQIRAAVLVLLSEEVP